MNLKLDEPYVDPVTGGILPAFVCDSWVKLGEAPDWVADEYKRRRTGTGFPNRAQRRRKRKR